MVDVVIHKTFPTIVSEFKFDMDDSERDIVIKELGSVEKKSNEIIIQTNDKLAERIPNFTRNIFDIANKILRETFKYEYDNLEITSMWANQLSKGETHPPHTHSNNVLSGVYYLHSKCEAPIQFFDPRPQANVLHPNIKYSNFENSGMISFRNDTGIGLMFPAWLQHWVPPTTDNRISISWNIILRGDYGQPGTLQNSHI
jgi:uncharacterized protein (TIGR02466 family)|tara:strand:- start:73 stop:672 length:600 start_codon:yes stop_codon:yes gene_type:complete